MLKQNKRAFSLSMVLRIAVVLTLIVVMSCSAVSGLYARYSSQVKGEATARVARYYVSAATTAEQNKNLVINYEENEESEEKSVDIDFSVMNYPSGDLNGVSEVSIEYGLLVVISETSDDAVFKGTMQLLDGHGNALAGNPDVVVSSDGKTLTVNKLGEFAAAERLLNLYKIRITVQGGCEGNFAVSLTVTASQKD